MIAQDAGADDDMERANGGENSDNDNDGGEDGGDQNKQAEYVKKEFVAREYISPYNTEAEVRSLTVKNSR